MEKGSFPVNSIPIMVILATQKNRMSCLHSRNHHQHQQDDTNQYSIHIAFSKRIAFSRRAECRACMTRTSTGSSMRMTKRSSQYALPCLHQQLNGKQHCLIDIAENVPVLTAGLPSLHVLNRTCMHVHPQKGTLSILKNVILQYVMVSYA